MATATSESTPCILCGRPATGIGEHVWPRWLLKRWLGEGPFTFEEDGNPVTSVAGRVRTKGEMAPVVVPVCSEKDEPGASCNAWLNERYEQPAMDLVRRVLDGEGALTGTEVRQFAEWWVKSLLLLHHPHTRVQFTGVDLSHWSLSDDVYRTWRATGAFPPDVSVWVAVANPEMRRRRHRGRLRSPGRVFVPETERSDGRGGSPHAGTTGFAMARGSELFLAQIALHPLVDLTHPFVDAGLAIRIWPDPPQTLDIGRLQRLDSDGEHRFSHTITTVDREFDLAINMKNRDQDGVSRQVDPLQREQIRTMLRPKFPQAQIKLEPGERIAAEATHLRTMASEADVRDALRTIESVSKWGARSRTGRPDPS
jgi:hypothetical protein